MNIRAEERQIKKLNVISSLPEYCLQANYPHYNRVESVYFQFLDFERWTQVILLVTITNAMPILTYYLYFENNSIIFIPANEYSNLNLVLFCDVINECLPHPILIRIDYCHMLYFQSYERLKINSMSYNLSFLCEIKFHQLSVSSVKRRWKEEKDIIWDNEIIEHWTNITMVQNLKWLSYGA
jgi:hypothetical protein